MDLGEAVRIGFDYIILVNPTWLLLMYINITCIYIFESASVGNIYKI